jgi:hypothetical protein
MVRSGPRVRTGQIYTIRFRVKGESAHRWTGPRRGTGRARVRRRSGPRSRVDPGRIGPADPFQYSNCTLLLDIILKGWMGFIGLTRRSTKGRVR